jgi:hypothetical protein
VYVCGRFNNLLHNINKTLSLFNIFLVTGKIVSCEALFCKQPSLGELELLVEHNVQLLHVSKFKVKTKQKDSVFPAHRYNIAIDLAQLSLVFCN